MKALALYLAAALFALAGLLAMVLPLPHEWWLPYCTGNLLGFCLLYTVEKVR